MSISFCLVSGTLISTPNGEIPIEKLKVGDKVLSAFDNPNNTHVAIVNRTIGNTSPDFFEIKFSNYSKVKATAVHPFRVGNRWVKARDLNLGDKIYSTVGINEIVSIEKVNRKAMVYDISVVPGHLKFIYSIDWELFTKFLMS